MMLACVPKRNSGSFKRNQAIIHHPTKVAKRNINRQERDEPLLQKALGSMLYCHQVEQALSLA